MALRHDLAQRLRQLMAQHGDTAATLAAVFGIRAQSVDSWLRTGRIGKDRLPALARRYSLSVAALLGQEEDDEDMLTHDERKLIEDYRALRDPFKESVLTQVNTLRRAQESGPPAFQKPPDPPANDKS